MRTREDDKPLYKPEILKYIRDADPSHPGCEFIAHLLDHFTHVGFNPEHECLVFNVMGERVDGLSRRFDCRPADLIKQIGRQILLTLDYLHTYYNIIHTGPYHISIRINHNLMH